MDANNCMKPARHITSITRTHSLLTYKAWVGLDNRKSSFADSTIVIKVADETYPLIINYLIENSNPNYDLIDTIMTDYISMNPSESKPKLADALGMTAIYNDDDIIIQMLMDHGVDVDIVTVYGSQGSKGNLLFEAAVDGALEIAKLLSSEGHEYNPNFTERFGYSLIEALKDRIEESPDSEQWSKILKRVEDRRDELKEDLEMELYDAIQDNNYEGVEDLINKLGYESVYLVDGKKLTAAEVASKTAMTSFPSTVTPSMPYAAARAESSFIFTWASRGVNSPY